MRSVAVAIACVGKCTAGTNSSSAHTSVVPMIGEGMRGQAMMAMEPGEVGGMSEVCVRGVEGRMIHFGVLAILRMQPWGQRCVVLTKFISWLSAPAHGVTWVARGLFDTRFRRSASCGQLGLSLFELAHIR